MKRLKDAEELHLEAIRIKSCILGDDDPEAGLPNWIGVQLDSNPNWIGLVIGWPEL